MNWPIVIAAVLIVSSMIAVMSFYKGTSAGYEEGYKAGKIHGEESGYLDGFKEGQADGHAAGKAEGHKAGEAAGWLKRDDEAKEKAKRIAAKRLATIAGKNGPWA